MNANEDDVVLMLKCAEAFYTPKVSKKSKHLRFFKACGSILRTQKAAVLRFTEECASRGVSQRETT